MVYVDAGILPHAIEEHILLLLRFMTLPHGLSKGDDAQAAF